MELVDTSFEHFSLSSYGLAGAMPPWVFGTGWGVWAIMDRVEKFQQIMISLIKLRWSGGSVVDLLA